MRVATMADLHPVDTSTWYVKRGDHIHGPFSWEIIIRNVGLGRVRATDSLSSDRLVWKSVEELVPLPSGALRELPVHDERRTDRRDTESPGDAAEDLRGGPDRRAAEAPELRARRARSARVWASLRPSPPGVRCTLLVTGLLLVILVAIAIDMAMPRQHTTVDCTSPPGAATVWDFCNKAGTELDDARLQGLSARSAQFSGASLASAHLQRADLAYADLSGTDLRLADLSNARLLGASLRHATLNHANLSGADLRYADLGGASLDGARYADARFDHAIWVDGRLCALNSIGHCRH